MPTLRPGDVVVLDNLAVHKQLTRAELIRAALDALKAVALQISDDGPDVYRPDAEPLTEYAAARMVEVDFITYRDDLSGSVACGPLKTPLSVYLTWRAGPGTPDGKLAVAIEFLPK